MGVTTAVLSGARGAMTELFLLTMPWIQRYAQKIGADFFDGPWKQHGRDPWWMKQVALAWALDQGYDHALWLDCDAVPRPETPNIFDAFPQDKWLGAVEHYTNDGQVFNVGVMAFRNGEQARTFVSELWRVGEKYQRRKWRDQAPALELLGYSTGCPVHAIGETEWSKGLHLLPGKWNVLTRYGLEGLILHFSGIPLERRISHFKAVFNELR